MSSEMRQIRAVIRRNYNLYHRQPIPYEVWAQNHELPHSDKFIDYQLDVLHRANQQAFSAGKVKILRFSSLRLGRKSQT